MTIVLFSTSRHTLDFESQNIIPTVQKFQALDRQIVMVEPSIYANDVVFPHWTLPIVQFSMQHRVSEVVSASIFR